MLGVDVVDFVGKSFVPTSTQPASNAACVAQNGQPDYYDMLHPAQSDQYHTYIPII